MIVKRPRSRQRMSRWETRVYAALSIAQALALVGAATAWTLSARWAAHPVVLGLITFVVISEAGFRLLRWAMLPLMRQPEPISCDEVMEGPTPPRIAAITTFVPGSEPLDMLRRTLAHMVAMDLPHDTWVLDEGDAPEVKALCAQLGVRHFSRKGDPELNTEQGRLKSRTKYGNVNAWLDREGFERYDLLAAFDTDHAPSRAFLAAAVGYFVEPAIAYVQFPQVYYNDRGAGFVARGAAEETYGYYGITQLVAHGGGWPVIVGCHTTTRVAALRELGGFAVHDADDMLLALQFRAAGYRGVYDPRVMAQGLTPTHWRDYLKQQRRWASSVFDIKFRVQPRMRLGLSPLSRLLNNIMSLAYLQAWVTLLGIALLLWLLVDEPRLFERGWWVLGTLVALSLTVRLGAAFAQRYHLRPERERGLLLRGMLVSYARWPVAIAGLVDVFAGGPREYALTNKVLAVRAGPTQWTIRVHAAVVVALIAAGAAGLLMPGVPNPVVVGFALWVGGMSLAVVLTERFVTFPPAYDEALAVRELGPMPRIGDGSTARSEEAGGDLVARTAGGGGDMLLPTTREGSPT